MFPSYRNQSVDLLGKSTDWFLNGFYKVKAKVEEDPQDKGTIVGTIPCRSIKYLVKILFEDSKFDLHLTFFVLTLSSCFLIFKLLELLLDKNL